MTREEALVKVPLREKNWGIVAQGVINQIYDEFESRTCDNCRYRQTNNANDMYWCINQYGANKYRNMDIRVDLDFGCNKFERKDKK